jgi:hypothetical protein
MVTPIISVNQPKDFLSFSWAQYLEQKLPASIPTMAITIILDKNAQLNE